MEDDVEASFLENGTFSLHVSPTTGSLEHQCPECSFVIQLIRGRCYTTKA